MMARYIIHVIGDIHQPLHASSLFNDDKFKNGDQGGNLFLIKYKNGINNLHKLFDSGVDQLNNDITRPLNDAENAYLEKTAQDFINEFPRDKQDEFNNHKDFSEWILESREISQNFVYKDIEMNTTPSEEYLKKGYYIIKKRIALAGYRIAEIFKQVIKSYKASSNVKSGNLEGFLRGNN